MRSRVLVAAVAVSGVLASGCGEQASDSSSTSSSTSGGKVIEKITKQPPKPVGKLVVTYEYPNYSLPFVLALNRNMFRDEGLEVEARKLRMFDKLSPDMDIDIINGHDFYALKDANGQLLMLHPFSRKADFKMAMLVKKSSGIRDWPDFKNKSIVVEGDRFSLLDATFKEHGLRCLGEVRDVTLQGGGGAVARFPTDEGADALYGWSETILPLMRESPNKYDILWKDLGSHGEPVSPLVACSYVYAKILPEKQDAVAAYCRAIDRAIDQLKRKPADALGVLPQYFGDIDTNAVPKMEVYAFHKSTDRVDVTLLSKELGIDVSTYVLDPATRKKGQRTLPVSGTTASGRASLPPYTSELQGSNPVRVRNPNQFAVAAGIRSGGKGADVDVPANGVNTVHVPDGKYEIYFVYSDKPDALFQGDSFTLNNNGVEIQIVKVVNGNYGIRQVK